MDLSHLFEDLEVPARCVKRPGNRGLASPRAALRMAEAKTPLARHLKEDRKSLPRVPPGKMYSSW